jgi:hypothetical protein
MLKKVQAVESQLSDDAQLKKHRPVGVVVDNATRWLSQFSMILRIFSMICYSSEIGVQGLKLSDYS